MIVTDIHIIAGEQSDMNSLAIDRCVLGKDCPLFGSTEGRRRETGMDTEDARADAQDRRRLQMDLKHAATSGGFVLHYQPRVTLATGAITGAEALIRWPHRKRGLISPERFIPLAEQNGLIGSIGAWALRAGCAEAAAWRDAAFLAHVAEALEAAALPPERIELELTESTLLAIDDDTLLVLSALRDMGMGLALDDFGTGYASLATLRRLPLTTLKIDRSLVRDLPWNREDAAIVGAVVATTHAMGLSVTAEGVETDAQCDFLRRIGTDDGQGQLFGRPVPGPRIREQLAA